MFGKLGGRVELAVCPCMRVRRVGAAYVMVEGFPSWCHSAVRQARSRPVRAVEAAELQDGSKVVGYGLEVKDSRWRCGRMLRYSMDVRPAAAAAAAPVSFDFLLPHNYSVESLGTASIELSMIGNRSGGVVALAGNETVAMNWKSWTLKTLSLP